MVWKFNYLIELVTFLVKLRIYNVWLEIYLKNIFWLRYIYVKFLYWREKFK